MRYKKELVDRVAALEEAVGTITAWKLTVTELESAVADLGEIKNIVATLDKTLGKMVGWKLDWLLNQKVFPEPQQKELETLNKNLSGLHDKVSRLQEQLEKMKAKTPKKETKEGA